MPAAWKTLPAWPATAVRVVIRLPSLSIEASCRRSRSRSRSAHSMTRPRLWHRSASYLLQHQGEERAEHVAADGSIRGAGLPARALVGRCCSGGSGSGSALPGYWANSCKAAVSSSPSSVPSSPVCCTGCDPLTHPTALPLVLDEIEIAMASRCLLADNHRRVVRGFADNIKKN